MVDVVAYNFKIFKSNILKKFFKYIFISFVFITITSKLSPIYPLNDWCDTNSFFTMGKALMRGSIIYKDLFEQKGPLLYFIYGIGYLISNKSFFGVYLMEILSFSFFLKLIEDCLYIIDFKARNHILLILSFIITTSLSFYGGGSAEEFCLPFISYNFFLLVKIFKGPGLKLSDFFVSGLFFSFVLLIKINLISFWFGFFIVCIIFYRKNDLFKKVLFFFIGFLISVIIVLAYFYFNNSIFEFIDVYFFKNIFEYNNTNFKLLALDNYLDGIVNLFVSEFIENFFLILSLIFSFFGAYKLRLLKFLLLIFIFPFIFICCQNNWFDYYSLPFCTFSIIGLVYIFKKIKIEKIHILLFLIPFTFVFAKNVYMLKYDKEDFVQYKFYDIIKEYDDQTLLNYNFIDTGFYLKLNTVPNVRFFHRMNFINFQEMEESINSYIETSKVNFIICVNTSDDFSYFNYVLKNYKLLDIERHNKDFGLYYALYVRK